MLKEALAVSSKCFLKQVRLKEACNSFFDLGVYLLKSKFRIENKLQFDFLDTTPPFQNMIKVYFLTGFLATAITIATVMDNPSF